MAERKKQKRGPNLSVGRGEKLPASKGAGLTAKGRAKYNRETGSKLKPPVTGKPKTKEEAARKRSSPAFGGLLLLSVALPGFPARALGRTSWPPLAGAPRGCLEA